MNLLPDSISRLAESPFWHPADNSLFWCDIDGQALCRYRPGEPVTRWSMPAEPGCIAPIKGGGLVVAMRDGIFLFDSVKQALEKVLDAPYDTRLFRFNDGRCDAAGRFLAGTLNEAKSASDAQLYSISRSRNQWQINRVAGGVMTANGLAFSPDGQTAYWADTRAHQVDAFDYSSVTGELSNRRCFIAFEPKPADGSLAGYGGRPDGAAVDELGGYWVAMYEGARVLRITPTGEIDQVIPMPVQCPTMVCFGGNDRRTLYVTSARAGRPETELARQQGAGGVFWQRVSSTGLPTAFFA